MVRGRFRGAGDYGGVGYTTTMSVRAGASIDFKIHSGGAPYSLDIIRLGWYGGDGARLYTTLTNPGKTQVNGNLRSTGEGGVGCRDCSNWTVTDTWQVPVDATNGVYLGVITTGRWRPLAMSARSPSTTSTATRPTSSASCPT